MIRFSAFSRYATLGFAAVLAFCLTPSAQAGLTWEPYRFTPRGQAEVIAQRAQLTVPLRHARPDGATITLRVVRLPAVQGRPGASPVVYLAGGPGGSGVAAAQGQRWPIFDAVRRERDVILLDQRGTGESTPPPACPHKVQFDESRAQDKDHVQSLAAFKQTAARCVAHWRALGLDPDAYSSVESAADLRALQTALEANALSLWGMSYGTHLAFAALKQPGLKIDRLLLMGSEGPNQTLKLPLDADALLERVAAASGTPDMVARLRQRIDAIQRAPLSADKPVPMVISAFDVQVVVAVMLARHQTAMLIPSVVSELEAGRVDIVAQILARVAQASTSMALMPLAMDVASGASASRLATVKAQEGKSVLGAALNFPYPQIGDGLGIADLGDAFRSDPRSDRPTQFVSGVFDGRTPVSNVAALEGGFTQRGHWVIDAAGHDDELWLTSPELPELIVRFLNGAAPTDRRLAPR